MFQVSFFQVIISTVAAIINLYCLLSCMIVDELRKKEFYLIGLQSLCDCVSSSAFITWGLAYYAHRFFFYCFGEHYDETFEILIQKFNPKFYPTFIFKKISSVVQFLRRLPTEAPFYGPHVFQNFDPLITPKSPLIAAESEGLPIAKNPKNCFLVRGVSQKFSIAMQPILS